MKKYKHIVTRALLLGALGLTLANSRAEEPEVLPTPDQTAPSSAPVAPAAVPAQQAPSEEQVKVAFLYNFARFVEWPPSAFEKSGDSFVIGVLGNDALGDELEQTLPGKTILNKKIELKRLPSVHDATSCHVIYISRSEEDQAQELLKQLHGLPVLTVSDMKRFIKRGGMIGFVLQSHKVGFSINQTVAEKNGLKISSQLLKLAKTLAQVLFLKTVG